MAIGATVGGRIADRVRSPLRMYGMLELVLVVVVLVTPLTFGLINEAYRGIYPALEGTPFLALVRLVLAVLALAPATILMGATFPALVRHLDPDGALSRAFGRLYAANTIGADRRHARWPASSSSSCSGCRGALAIGAGVLAHRRPHRAVAVARRRPSRDRRPEPSTTDAAIPQPAQRRGSTGAAPRRRSSGWRSSSPSSPA